jgi:hypothetical protein
MNKKTKPTHTTIKNFEIMRTVRRCRCILREPESGGRDSFHHQALSDCCLISDLQ